MSKKTYHGLPVVWGGNEQGTREHAFAVRPPAWRSFKPRAICGTAWSTESPPVPSPSLPRCKTCTGILQCPALAADGTTAGGTPTETTEGNPS